MVSTAISCGSALNTGGVIDGAFGLILGFDGIQLIEIVKQITTLQIMNIIFGIELLFLVSNHIKTSIV